MAHAQPTTPTVAVHMRSARPEGPGHVGARTAALRRYADECAWTVSAVFVEVRPSGIRDAMLGVLTEYDVVLVEEWSRLSRNLARSAEIYRCLQAAGIHVVARSGAGGVLADDKGWAEFEHLLSALVAEAERDAHVRLTMAGAAAARARRGEQR